MSFLADEFMVMKCGSLRVLACPFLVKQHSSGHNIILNFAGRKCYFVSGHFERICCTSISVLVFSNK